MKLNNLLIALNSVCYQLTSSILLQTILLLYKLSILNIFSDNQTDAWHGRNGLFRSKISANLVSALF